MENHIYAWTEVGVGDQEFEQYAFELKNTKTSWQQIQTIIYRDVLWGSWLSLSLWLAVLILLLRAALLVDWGFEDKRLSQKINHIQKWQLFYKLNSLAWIRYLIGY